MSLNAAGRVDMINGSVSEVEELQMRLTRTLSERDSLIEQLNDHFEKVLTAMNEVCIDLHFSRCCWL